MFKIKKGLLVGVLSILAYFNTLANNNGHLQQDSISSTEKVKLGGLYQTIMIHGKDSSKPVLLTVHGGPGFVESYLFRTYNKELEDHFVVVYWDQRGAGLSYTSNIPPETMTMAQIIADGHELVQYLEQRFHKEKIYLLGHSWGSAIGISLVQQYPQDFYGYIGVGQVVDMWQNEKRSYQYTLDKANKEKNQPAITELKKIAGNYDNNAPFSLDALYIQRKWLDVYHGAVWGNGGMDRIFNGITAPERALYDKEKNIEAQQFSMNYLWKDIMKVNFIKTASTLLVPVYFFTGRHDYNTLYSLVQEYNAVLKAPHKEIVWFENSAHLMPFEEPAKFNKLVVEKLLSSSGSH